MVLLKPIVLLIVFAAALLFALFGFSSVAAWWNRRLARYTDWMVEALKFMGEPADLARIRRTITIAIFGPLAAFVSVGAWPIGLLAGAVGGAVPYGLTRYRKYLFRQTMDNQLVDVLIMMGNSLKAGLSLQQAIEMAANESRKPIVTEFERVMKEVQLGQSIDHALLQMSERVGLRDLEIAVHSIVTLRETGGNLSETFMTVANTIVERKKVEGKIAALTAQGVYQGLAMCCMPFVMGGIFYILDPDYMRLMMTTAIGWALWVLVFILDGIGLYVMLKVVKIDV